MIDEKYILKEEDINVSAKTDNGEEVYFFLRVKRKKVRDEMNRRFKLWKAEPGPVIEGLPTCILSVWNTDIKQWISQTGVPSRMVYADEHQEKAEYNDAFVMAAQYHGIGAELVQFEDLVASVKDVNGQPQINVFTASDGSYRVLDKFRLEQIIYDEQGFVAAAAIRDLDTGKLVVREDRRKRNDKEKIVATLTEADNARQLQHDVKQKGITGAKLGTLSSEELLYVYKNTKLPEVKKAAILIAAESDEFIAVFRSAGIQV